MSLRSIVIAGTGQAGFQAASSLRSEGYDGEIVMIGDEPGLPYQRPPLSKTYIKEGRAERLLLRPESFYETNRITLLANRRVETIDRRARAVELDGGDRLGYDHLILATGARNRRLPIEGADLRGVVELRTMAHADEIRDLIASSQSVIIIGAGFIGLEFAAMARGLDAEVTVLEAAPRAMARVVSAPVSEHFAQYHAATGVTIHFGASAVRIRDDGSGSASGVELGDGTVIAGDLVLVSVGVAANDELARVAGLATDVGITVDESLLTDDPAISAIGDCASFIHPLAGSRGRIESVQNATDQGKAVAARLAGKGAAPYAAFPWFWSDQGERKLQIAGLTGTADRHVVREGENGKLAVHCFAGEDYIGLESVNAPAEHVAVRKMLGEGQAITFADLQAHDFDLKALRAALAG